MGAPLTINFINFNQDFSCISVGTGSGYKIFNCDPFGKCFSKIDLGGGAGIVEMLFCTSLVAIVGIGDQPSMSPRRLKIVNTKRQSTICELTFPTAILKVKLNRRRLVVLLEEQIYIYDISNMRLLHTIETAPNPSGIVALSPSSTESSCYLVYPSSSGPAFADINGKDTANSGNATSATTLPGHVPPVVAMGPNSAPSRTGEVTIFDTITLQPINVVEAHRSPISQLSLNNEGTLMATASDKGTIIRIFTIPSGQKLYQFRRGTYPSHVYSLNFNLASTMLVVSSSSETVHIFRLSDNDASVDTILDNKQQTILSSRNGNHSMGGMSFPQNDTPSSPGTVSRTDLVRNTVGGYLPSAVQGFWEPKTRDFASFKLPVPSGTKTIAALSSFSNQCLVLTGDGYFYQYAINSSKGGECEMVRQYSLHDPEELP